MEAEKSDTQLVLKFKPHIKIFTIRDDVSFCLTTLEHYKVFLEHLSTGRDKWHLRGAAQVKKSDEQKEIEKTETKEWKDEKIRKYKDLYQYSVSGNAIKLWDAQNMAKAIRAKSKRELPAGFDVHFAIAFQMMIQKASDVEYFHIKRIVQEKDFLEVQKACFLQIEKANHY